MKKQFSKEEGCTSKHTGVDKNKKKGPLTGEDLGTFVPDQPATWRRKKDRKGLCSYSASWVHSC